MNEKGTVASKFYPLKLLLTITGMLGGNTTQQQLAAAMQAHQTQNLLAILQAQQFSGMNSGSLLPTPTGMNQRGKVWIL